MLRAASSTYVSGFSVATVSIQPLRSASGTYTGAKKRIRKTGICMIGPAWIVRKRIATPHAQSSPAMLIRSASVYMPKTSTGPPKTFIPAISATTVSTVAVTVQRTSAAIA